MATDELYANYFLIEIDFAKDLAQFQKTEGFKNENNQKVSLKKVPLLTLYSSMRKK